MSQRDTFTILNAEQKLLEVSVMFVLDASVQ